MASPPKHPTDHVRFLSLASWVKAAVLCQINIEPLLSDIGIADALGSDPTPPIRVSDLASLMVRCTDLAWPQSYFPIKVGEQFAFDQLPALETFLTTAATPRDALQALAWIGQVFPHVTMRLVEEGDQAALLVDTTLDVGHARGQGCLIEKDMASIRRFTRAMLGDSAWGYHVALRHTPSPEVHAVLESHLGLPVLAGQACNAVRFPRHLLDEPMCGAVPALHRHARSQVERQLPPAPTASVTDTLATWFRREPHLMDAPLHEVAGRLLLHPRTLQRRLDDAGLSYARLRDDCRRLIAQEALSKPDEKPDLDQLVEQLGFSDRNSFTRAFKRWTGQTPAAWLKQQRSE